MKRELIAEIDDKERRKNERLLEMVEEGDMDWWKNLSDNTKSKLVMKDESHHFKDDTINAVIIQRWIEEHNGIRAD